MTKETTHSPHMLYSAYYTIADCTICVRVNVPGLHLPDLLPSFEGFKSEPVPDGQVVSEIILTEDSFDTAPKGARLLSDISIVWGNRFRFYEIADQYVTSIMSEHSPSKWFMRSTKDFSHSTIHWVHEYRGTNELLSWLLMVTFAQSALAYGTILIHASVIKRNNVAYAFLGKSGTGKSTHSRLWQTHIPGSRLLNDDNPAIRVREGERTCIYGTPWSGKTPCYRNEGAELHAIVRLKQAAQNRMEWKSGQFAFITLLPSCSALRWNQQLFARMNDMLVTLVQHIPVGELECLPNKEAVQICKNEIEKKHR